MFVIDLLCFGSEVVLYFQTPAVDVSLSNFTRPLLLNIASVMTAIIAVLGTVTLMFAVCTYTLVSPDQSLKNSTSTEAMLLGWPKFLL